jgi:alkanesulfonate monooxygenase SsuD/methylene tetrahydromethanopterin reductase-like flavin-dependent oxidoreductase (luciferase family)
MRRVGRRGVGWLAFERPPDAVAGHLWSIARRAAEDAGRDPDALKTAMRINLEPGTARRRPADRARQSHDDADPASHRGRRPALRALKLPGAQYGAEPTACKDSPATADKVRQVLGLPPTISYGARILVLAG